MTAEQEYNKLTENYKKFIATEIKPVLERVARTGKREFTFLFSNYPEWFVEGEIDNVFIGCLDELFGENYTCSCEKENVEIKFKWYGMYN